MYAGQGKYVLVGQEANSANSISLMGALDQFKMLS